MALHWHGDEFLKRLKAHETQQLTRACIHLTNRVKENISEPSNHGKTPSDPGDYPHKDTGRLRASISYEVDPQALKGRVGTNVVYGKFLELGTSKMAPRPFLRSTAIAERKVIDGILAKPMK